MPPRRVDCSDSSFMPRCPLCSWREYPRATYVAAIAVADRHALEVHASDSARNAITQRARRAR